MKLTPENIQDIIKEDYEQNSGMKPRATSLTVVRECSFLRLYDSSYDGWFVTAEFDTLPAETWFVVFLDDEDDWWIEPIKPSI